MILSLAIPFVSVPSLQIFFLASISTVGWTLGAYLMFKALKSGQVQRVIPIIGTITPLILLILASQTNAITTEQTVAIVVLILGLMLLTLANWRGKLSKAELLLELSSALFFALSYYFLRLAFEKADFLTVLVWSRPILIPLGVIFLIIPTLREKIIQFKNFGSLSLKKTALIFMFGQVSAGVSELLLFFAISLANPAIVNSLQGVKYVFILGFSWLLGKKFPQVFKNQISPLFLISQIVGIALLGIGLYLLFRFRF